MLGALRRYDHVSMDWSLNDAQAAVLSWICTTPQAEPPPGNWKASMSALVSRGLATVSKRGGRYTANPTDTGRYFHQHGEYPTDSAGGRHAGGEASPVRGCRTELAAPSPRTVTGSRGGESHKAAVTSGGYEYATRATRRCAATHREATSRS